MSDKPTNIEGTGRESSEQAAVAKIMDEIFSHRSSVSDSKGFIPGSKGHESLHNLPGAGDKNTLERFDITSMGDLGDKSILSKVGDCAAKAAGATKDFIVDTTKTIVSIPKEDWLDVADAAKEVAKKDGTTLAVDIGLVVGSKGTNILADGKLAQDLHQTITSEEGKRLGSEISEAWKNGEKNKVV